MEDIVSTPRGESKADMEEEGGETKTGMEGQMDLLRPSILKMQADRSLKESEGWMMKMILKM